MEMIDFENEIFTAVATAVRKAHSGTSIKSEYVRSPATFPTVALSEVDNVNVDALMDSSGLEKYAGLGYRLQVFSNKEGGKKAEAKAIFKTADDILCGMGFRRRSYSTTPEIYNSTIFSITATYEGIANKNGVIYNR
jgi:hypothetical protein